MYPALSLWERVRVRVLLKFVSMLFKEFSLQPGILKGLTEMKYESATDIQTHVIKLALAGKNIVGQSQTGTGKTAAFVIPLLQNIDTSKK